MKVLLLNPAFFPRHFRSSHSPGMDELGFVLKEMRRVRLDSSPDCPTNLQDIELR